MIFYFSATGNCKYVAIRLAQEGEEIIAIADMLREKRYSFEVPVGEKVGIISPTYNWTIPSVVSDFLEKLELQYDQRPYLYYVGTFGTTTGAAAAMADRYMKEKGYPFDAYFDVKMPDTWTPTYDLSNPKHVAEINRNAEKNINQVKLLVGQQVKGKHMHPTLPLIAGRGGKYIYDKKTRNTSNLMVEDACIGCGLCAKKCPVEAIEMRNKKPVWVKEQCTMCLGCLHRCPKFAIQCGPNTKKHGQYVNPNVKI